MSGSIFQLEMVCMYFVSEIYNVRLLFWWTENFCPQLLLKLCQLQQQNLFFSIAIFDMTIQLMCKTVEPKGRCINVGKYFLHFLSWFQLGQS